MESFRKVCACTTHQIRKSRFELARLTRVRARARAHRTPPSHTRTHVHTVRNFQQVAFQARIDKGRSDREMRAIRERVGQDRRLVASSSVRRRLFSAPLKFEQIRMPYGLPRRGKKSGERAGIEGRGTKYKFDFVCRFRRQTLREETRARANSRFDEKSKRKQTEIS